MIPRAKRSAVDGVRGGAVVIRLAAPPVDGAANQALVDFLSERLRLPRRHVSIVSGEKSRDKRVQILGLDAAAVRDRLLK